MRRLAFVVFVVLVVCLSGCTDDRVKRGASVFNAKTKVAKKEFMAAVTDADKVKVAEEYFRNADEFTQGFEDYLFGRKPAEIVKLPGSN